ITNKRLDIILNHVADNKRLAKDLSLNIVHRCASVFSHCSENDRRHWRYRFQLLSAIQTRSKGRPVNLYRGRLPERAWRTARRKWLISYSASGRLTDHN